MGSDAHICFDGNFAEAEEIIKSSEFLGENILNTWWKSIELSKV